MDTYSQQSGPSFKEGVGPETVLTMIYAQRQAVGAAVASLVCVPDVWALLAKVLQPQWELVAVIAMEAEGHLYANRTHMH